MGYQELNPGQPQARQARWTCCSLVPFQAELPFPVSLPGCLLPGHRLFPIPKKSARDLWGGPAYWFMCLLCSPKAFTLEYVFPLALSRAF